MCQGLSQLPILGINSSNPLMTGILISWGPINPYGLGFFSWEKKMFCFHSSQPPITSHLRLANHQLAFLITLGIVAEDVVLLKNTWGKCWNSQMFIPIFCSIGQLLHRFTDFVGRFAISFFWTFWVQNCSMDLVVDR